MGSFGHESSDLQHPERRGTKLCSLGFLFLFFKSQNLVPAEMVVAFRNWPIQGSTDGITVPGCMLVRDIPAVLAGTE